MRRGAFRYRGRSGGATLQVLEKGWYQGWLPGEPRTGHKRAATPGKYLRKCRRVPRRAACLSFSPIRQGRSTNTRIALPDVVVPEPCGLRRPETSHGQRQALPQPRGMTFGQLSEEE